ncbi:hypothetical protein Tco_0005047 [Tanacetum coccineum]
MKRVNTFVAMGSKVQENKEKKEEGREETAKGSRKKMLGRKRAGKEQQKESSKKLKGKAYMLRDRNAHQDPNVVTGMFLLNQHLARVLFDSGADKSLLGLKRLYGFLEVAAAQCCWWKDYDCLKTFYCQEDKDALKR